MRMRYRGACALPVLVGRLILRLIHLKSLQTHSATIHFRYVIVYLMACIGIFAGTAKYAYAGFFSDLIGRVFAESAVVEEEHVFSSQSVPLLSSQSEVQSSLHEYVVADSGALLALSGPMGGVAELTELQQQTARGEISTYIVEEGDTVASIALKYGISSNTILWANGLNKKSPLKVGQTLVILPITSVQHKIQKGDTIPAIAKKYGGDIEEIIAYNDIEDGKIIVGQTVIIPNGEMPATPVAPKATSPKTGAFVSSRDVGGYFLSPLASYRKTQGIHGHNAVDLVAPVGTAIRAAADGVVIVANTSGWGGGYGKYVVVKHSNGTQTLYSHLSSVAVRVGQSVDRGQTLGGLGNTGRSTGPHLHFEVRGARNPF